MKTYTALVLGALFATATSVSTNYKAPSNQAFAKINLGTTTSHISGKITFHRYKKHFVQGEITVSGLAEGKEYLFHVHETKTTAALATLTNPICNTAGGHFKQAGSQGNCPAWLASSTTAAPHKRDACEWGDLSGKWGVLKVTKYNKHKATLKFKDIYLKFDDLTNRSVVIHEKTATGVPPRIGCGDIKVHHADY
jgi:hypothetical protein